MLLSGLNHLVFCCKAILGVFIAFVKADVLLNYVGLLALESVVGHGRV